MIYCRLWKKYFTIILQSDNFNYFYSPKQNKTMKKFIALAAIGFLACSVSSVSYGRDVGKEIKYEKSSVSSYDLAVNLPVAISTTYQVVAAITVEKNDLSAVNQSKLVTEVAEAVGWLDYRSCARHNFILHRHKRLTTEKPGSRYAYRRLWRNTKGAVSTSYLYRITNRIRNPSAA